MEHILKRKTSECVRSASNTDLTNYRFKC